MVEKTLAKGRVGTLNPIQMTWFIIMELLLVFGVKFSKFHIYGPIHLYDLILGILALTSLVIFQKRQQRIVIWSIAVILVISIIYLLYSFYFSLGPVEYILRQYTVFIYLGCYYLIFFSFIDSGSQKNNLKFLVILAFSSVLIQFGTHVFNFIFIQNYSELFFEEFNYHSLPTIVGILIFLCFILVYDKSFIRKTILILLVIVFSISIGHHGSTILASVIILGAYGFLLLKKTFRYLSLALIPVLLYLLFFYLPQFQDVNSIWRLIYWKYSINEIVTEYYGIFGHGFGGPYVSQDAIEEMKTRIDSSWMETRPEEQYITPLHNSFLTIAYNIGLLPALLIFIPAIPIFRYYFNRDKQSKSDTNDFVFLLYIGITVWISFHVTLELPHLSGIYWFIYFTSVFHFGKKYFEEKSWNLLTIGNLSKK